CFHPYDWPDFRQMYRNADLVVVSLLDNHYSAGLTVLMEAMACCRPVLITRTPGLSEVLIDKGIVAGVSPGDIEGMRKIITYYLDNPAEANALAEKGHHYFQSEHTSELFIERLAGKLHQVADGSLRAEPHLITA
ncbi:MAG: glycosyltransferase family 4 protein, partial [Moorea sp. SIO3C2]|nr:glycosyltransferase family 4 protein [Moorena sp. SIO3C2]